MFRVFVVACWFFVMTLSSSYGASTARMVLQTGPQAPPVATAWSPDGRTIALACRDEDSENQAATLIWQPHARRVIATIPGGASGVHFLGNGAQLAVLHAHEVAVYNPRTGGKLRVLSAPQGAKFLAFAFSEDERTLVTLDTKVRVWDWKAGREARVLKVAPQPHDGNEISELVFALSPDAKWLALQIQGYDAPRLLDLKTEKVAVWAMTSPTWQGNALTFSPDSRYMASGLEVWDLQTRKRVKGGWEDVEKQPVLGCKGAQWSKDGRKLMVHAVRHLPPTRAQIAVNKTRNPPLNSHFELWDFAARKRESSFDSAPDDFFLLWKIAPNGQDFIVARSARWEMFPGLLAFRAGQKTPFARLVARSYGLNWPEFEADGQKIRFDGDDKITRVFGWQTSPALLASRPQTRRRHPARHVIFARGDFELSAEKTGLVARESGKIVWQKSPPHGLTQLETAVSEDGETLLAQWRKGHVVLTSPYDPDAISQAPTKPTASPMPMVLFEMRTGAEKLRLETEPFDVWSARFLSSGELLLAGENFVARFSEGGKLISRWPFEFLRGPYSGEEIYPGFSDDGRALLLWSDGAYPQLEIWNCAQQKRIWRDTSARLSVLQWEFSSNSRYIALFTSDLRLIQIDLETGRTQEIPGQSSRSNGIAYSPNGQILVNSSNDGTLQFWRVKDGKLMATLFFPPPQKSGETGEDWVCFTPEGFYCGSPGGEKFVGWNRGGEYVAQIPTFRRPDLVARALRGESVGK